MSQLDEFQEHARRAFDFLREYGFLLEGGNSAAGETYLRFVRDDIVVTANYQPGDGSWVTLSFPGRGVRTSLQKVARQLQVSDVAALRGGTLREQVERDAKLLRACIEAYGRGGDAGVYPNQADT